MQQPPSGQDWPQQGQQPYGYGQPSQPLPPNTQWGQQPSQYPPQQGQWQQPYGQPPPAPGWQPPQPPKKSRKGLWIVLGIVAALVVFGCIGISAVVSQASKNVNTAVNNAQATVDTSLTQLPTSPPTQTSQTNTIGKAVQVGDTWVVTLNKVSTSKGDELNVPKSGHTFLVVNVTLKNNSSSNQSASSLGMFSLKDSSGQTYNQSITFSGSPDGTVAAGGVVRGNIYYEVPASTHNYTLQFTPSLTSTDLAEWNVKI